MVPMESTAWDPGLFRKGVQLFKIGIGDHV
jgi:hypothetical protein